MCRVRRVLKVKVQFNIFDWNSLPTQRTFDTAMRRSYRMAAADRGVTGELLDRFPSCLVIQLQVEDESPAMQMRFT